MSIRHSTRSHFPTKVHLSRPGKDDAALSVSLKDEAGAFTPQQFVREEAANAEAHAGIWDFDSVGGTGGHFVSNHCVAPFMSLRDEMVVRSVEEVVACRCAVTRVCGPSGDRFVRIKCCGSWSEEESPRQVTNPLRKIILLASEFVANTLDTEEQAISMSCAEPVPKAGTKIETVVQAFRGDEDVRVQQIWHQAVNPSR